MKKGYDGYKEKNDITALENINIYRATFNPPELFPIIRYRTVWGEDFGVLMNKGERVTIWNGFTEKLEHYHIHDYENRFIGMV
jgi:hypothetical protein